MKLSSHHPEKLLLTVEKILDKITDIRFYREDGRYYIEFQEKGGINNG